MSGVIGGEIQLTDRLRADLGVRVEYNNYVQASENTAPVDLDDDPTTTFDNMNYGNNTFRHFNHDITDWAGSLGLNYVVNDNLAVYAAGSRGYKMPALDDLLNAQAQAQVDLFDAREVQSVEGGVKTQLGRVAFTVNGFYTKLKNQIGQGAEFDPGTGRTDVGHHGEPGYPLLRRRARGRSSRRSRGSSSRAAPPSCRRSSGGGVDSLLLPQGSPARPRAQDVGESGGDVLASGAFEFPAGGRLPLGRLPVLRGCGQEEPRHRPGHPAVLQLLQLRRELSLPGVRGPAQRGPAERLPEQGTGGG